MKTFVGMLIELKCRIEEGEQMLTLFNLDLLLVKQKN